MSDPLPTDGNHEGNSAPSPKKVLIPVVVILLLVASGLFMIRTAFERSGGGGPFKLAQGKEVPDLTLHRLEGGETKLSALNKKIVILNFWATWCESCLLEMPSLVELREAFKDRGFEVLGVNVDDNPETAVPPVLREMGIRFPVFVDKGNTLGELFDVSAIPTSIVLDSNRKVLYIETGERDWNSQKVKDQIERWLKG